MDKIVLRTGVLLFLVILIGFAFLPDANNWDNIVKLKVNLQKCLKWKENKWKKDNLNQKIKMTAIGAFVDTSNIRILESPMNSRWFVVVRVLPYIVSQIPNKKIVLIPSLQQKGGVSQEFYPTCLPTDNNLAQNKNDINLYPQILLGVESQAQRKLLIKHLEQLPEQVGEFLNSPIQVNSVENMGQLLRQVFQQQQASFLEGLPFKVRISVGLRDETRKWISYTVSDFSEVEIDTHLKNKSQKLIVVSLSSSLKNNGKVIRESLMEVISTLKKTETSFTLLTIQTGRKVYSLFSSDDLVQNNDKLWEQIELGMHFGANDLRALDDLNLVDYFIQGQYDFGNEPIGSLLYLTDNKRMSDNPREIPSRQRGVPLVWRKDGIALTVLTTKQCQVWEYVGAKCISWQDETDLKRALNTFIQ